MRPTPSFVLPLFAATLLASSFSAYAGGDIAVTITPDSPSLGKRDNVMVTVTLTNTGGAPEGLPIWRTPFTPLQTSLFDITRDGVPVRYLGREVKRAVPSAADFVTLAPGETRGARVELSSLYEMATTGAYAIRYRGALPVQPTQDARAPAPGTLRSNGASIWIEGRLPRGVAPATAAPAPAGTSASELSYAHCSNGQQDKIADALRAGAVMAAGGLAYMERGEAPGPRYLNWFGALDGARQSTVTKHFTAIKDAFDTKPVKVDCGCDEDYFAYVYPAQPYTIHVCKAFWTAPMTGTDSMGGTLVHEMSHFNVVAGTDDHVYGSQVRPRWRARHLTAQSTTPTRTSTLARTIRP